MTRQRMAASIGIVWCVVSLAGARQQSPDPAQWVPADAVAYLGIADPAALITGARSPDDVRIIEVSDQDFSVPEHDFPDLETSTGFQPHTGWKEYTERATT